MDWAIVSAIGEVLGAVAVVISIWYLAAQVKHNTESVRGQAFQSLIDRVAAVNSRTDEAQVADVVARGRKSYLELSESEIAETLGISKNSVKTHCRRGMETLRSRLEMPT